MTVTPVGLVDVTSRRVLGMNQGQGFSINCVKELLLADTD